MRELLSQHSIMRVDGALEAARRRELQHSYVQVLAPSPYKPPCAADPRTENAGGVGVAGGNAGGEAARGRQDGRADWTTVLAERAATLRLRHSQAAAVAAAHHARTQQQASALSLAASKAQTSPFLAGGGTVPPVPSGPPPKPLSASRQLSADVQRAMAEGAHQAICGARRASHLAPLRAADTRVNACTRAAGCGQSGCGGERCGVSGCGVVLEEAAAIDLCRDTEAAAIATATSTAARRKAPATNAPARSRGAACMVPHPRSGMRPPAHLQQQSHAEHAEHADTRFVSCVVHRICEYVRRVLPASFLVRARGREHRGSLVSCARFCVPCDVSGVPLEPEPLRHVELWCTLIGWGNVHIGDVPVPYAADYRCAFPSILEAVIHRVPAGAAPPPTPHAHGRAAFAPADEAHRHVISLQLAAEPLILADVETRLLPGATHRGARAAARAR